MVNQANNNLGDIVTFHRAAASSYGTWMALANTRDRIRDNLLPQKLPRRTINNSYDQHDWAATHAWGKEFAKLYGTNSESMPSLFRRPKPVYVSRATYATLRDRVLSKRVKVSSRSEATEPVWFQCASCDRMHNYSESTETVGNNTVLVCQDCIDDNVVRTSNCMNGVILSYDSVQVFHDTEAVENHDPDFATPQWCARNGYFRRQGYYYSQAALEAISVVDETIYGYHSGPDLPKIASPEYDKRKPRVLLGMELEVENVDSEDNEDVSNEDIAKSIYRSIGKAVKDYMKCERDGSLDNGFEIITAPTGLDIHEKALSELRNAEYFSHIHSHSTDTCGLHVHVCKAGMTVLHAAKLQQFINAEENKGLVRCVARRYQTGNSGYAKIDHRNWLKTMGEVAGPAIRRSRADKRNGYGNGRIIHADYTNGNFSYDRYSALNFRNDHTVEFRLFRGTLKFESIMACLEFAYASWFFSREAAIGQLTTENFMKFITRADNRKDTKHLRAYLKAKKFRAFFQAEQIARPKFKGIAPTERDERVMLDEDPFHIPMHEPRVEHRVAA